MLLRLRNDLVISPQRQEGRTVFIVKDPLSGRFFSLKEPEYFIACGLDGSTTFEDLRRRTEERFSAPLPERSLQRFIEGLWRLGLLESEGTESGHFAHRTGRIVRGTLLYLRFKAFDPDRLFGRLASKAGFFFTSRFLAISAAFIFLALWTTVVNWSEIEGDLGRLFRFETVIFAYLIVLLVTAAHELAHGLACKRLGGEVHETGFMLIFFMPAFYCNVSDVWLFPDKSKRLLVTFAGAYFELFVWALATLAWRLTDPDTVVSHAALVVMATSGVKTLFNLNPLIKLDGYYLLSDYLEIPNLRQRAFGYVRSSIGSLWGAAAQAAGAAGARERRIYLTYGLLAGTYSFALLGAIGLKAGGHLIEEYQGMGLLIFSGLLLALFRNSIKRTLPTLSLVLNREGTMLLDRRQAKTLATALLVLALLFLARMELRVSGEFKVLPAQNAEVRASVEGIIEEVLVGEGDTVARGDLVVRLSERDLSAELQKVEAEIEEKHARLRMLKAGARPEEIDVAKSVVARAQEQLKHANALLTISKSAFERQLISQKELQEALAQVAVRVQEREEARNRLKVLLAGSRREEIEATEAEVARLETQRRYLQGQVHLMKVITPASGVITTPKLRDKIGQLAKKGDLIAQVHDLETIRAEIAVPEKEIADVKVGSRVVLKARSYPERSFYGEVVSIAPMVTADEKERGIKSVTVTTRLDNSPLLLKPEMTGNAKIYCGTRPIIHLMARRLMRYIRVEFWSWW